MAPEPGAISSMTRALRVLEAVASAGDGVTAKAIARRLGSPLPTVYRALGVLVDEGFLVRLHDVRGYGLGPRVGELHRALVEQVRPPEVVRPVLYEVLSEVHRDVGAATYYATLRDADVAVAHVDDCACHPGPLRVGDLLPARATAAGKVLLSGLDPAPLAELLGRDEPPGTDRRALHRELTRVRSVGAAVEVDTLASGVAGIAVPVVDAGGVCVGAFGVTADSVDFGVRRVELERAARHGALLVGSAFAENPRSGPPD